jgi:molybdenum cofactor cytidylyltransferase
MNEIPVLLLAAGGSSRMGQPKQLLPWGKSTLIEHQIKSLISTGNPVNVVLGSSADLIIPIIKDYKISIFINNSWESGMGSSLSLGISQIMTLFPKTCGALITLLDQPLISASYYEKMIGLFQPGLQQILASHSASGWTGVPVLFDKHYFEELKMLKNDEGAKKVIRQHEENVIVVECDEIMEDMDTPESYELLLKKYINKLTPEA